MKPSGIIQKIRACKDQTIRRLFLIFFSLYMVRCMLAELTVTGPVPDDADRVLLFICLAAFSVLALFALIRAGKRAWPAAALAAAGMTASFFMLQTVNGFLELLLIALVILSALSVDFDRTALATWIVLGVSILLFGALAAAGVAENRTDVRDGLLRWAMGFSHPNQLGLFTFHWLCCLYWLLRKRFSFAAVIGGIVSAIYVYLIPNSQTGCLGCCAVTLLYVLWHFVFRGRKKACRRAGVVLIVLALAVNPVSIWLSTREFSQGSLLWRLDKLLSSRFSMGYLFWQTNGGTLHLLGQRIDAGNAALAQGLTSVRSYLDNSYFTFFLRYGIIAWAALTVLIAVALISAWKREEHFLLVILFCYCVYGVMENVFLSLARNVFIIAAAQVVCAAAAGAYFRIKKRREGGESVVRD